MKTITYNEIKDLIKKVVDLDNEDYTTGYKNELQKPGDYVSFYQRNYTKPSFKVVRLNEDTIELVDLSGDIMSRGQKFKFKVVNNYSARIDKIKEFLNSF